MLEVKIDNIIPVTEARDSFNQLVDKVEGSDEMYVLTKNGKPSAILVGVHHLEKLTGTSHEELMGEVAAAKSEETPAPATEVKADDPATEPVIAPVISPATPTPAPTEPVPAVPEAPSAPVTPAPAAPATNSSAEPFSSPLAASDEDFKNTQDSPFAYDNTATPVASATSPAPASTPGFNVPEDSTAPADDLDALDSPASQSVNQSVNQPVNPLDNSATSTPPADPTAF